MRLALCLEQTLGHRSHSQNLLHRAADMGLEPAVYEVYPPAASRIPWAIQGSRRADLMLRRGGDLDVRFYHTQSIALFAPIVRRKRPYVVSIDATPVQMDALGAGYGHGPSPKLLEALKARWYRAVFQEAGAIVAWSQWAADSLRADYGAREARIVVRHPGAGEPFFQIRRPGARPSRLPNILFVGGDFHRKGGDSLLAAFEVLRGRADLTIVSPEHVGFGEGVRHISGATPGSEALLRAFSEADIFCLPTRSDCTPMVLGEAMAAGLPVVTTPVGSNAETVTDGETGFLVPAEDHAALSEALLRLIEDPALSRIMGARARAEASARFNAAANASDIFALLREVA